MRILSWSLNHRAARRRIPPWIPSAVQNQLPDVVVLTEYVVGLDQECFLEALRRAWLSHHAVSAYVPRQNQVLVISREPLAPGELAAPAIHSSVPSNALHMLLSSGVNILGFRVPAFVGADRPRKRETWDWLVRAAATIKARASVITGDFNTAPGDSQARCGDCIDELTRGGWKLVLPPPGWRRLQAKTYDFVRNRPQPTSALPSVPESSTPCA